MQILSECSYLINGYPTRNKKTAKVITTTPTSASSIQLHIPNPDSGAKFSQSQNSPDLTPENQATIPIILLKNLTSERAH